MEFLRQTVAVVAVLGMLLAALAWARRHGGVRFAGSAVRRMQALERLALGPHHTLHLVRLEEHAILVACFPGGCSVLEKVPARTSEAPPEARR